MQTKKEVLAQKRKSLADKEGELEQLKKHLQWKHHLQSQKSHGHVISADHHMSLPEHQMTDTRESHNSTSFIPIATKTPGIPPSTTEGQEAASKMVPQVQTFQKTPPHSHRKTKATEMERTPVTTPQSTPHKTRERGTPSTSKKRHFSIFEAKTKQLVEEEGQTFKALQRSQQDNLLGKESKAGVSSGLSAHAMKRPDFSAEDIHVSGNRVQERDSFTDKPKTSVSGTFAVPKDDEQRYKEEAGNTEISYRRKILGDTKGRKRETLQKKPSPVREDQHATMTPSFLDEVMSSFERRHSNEDVSQDLAVNARPQSITNGGGGGKLSPSGNATKKVNINVVWCKPIFCWHTCWHKKPASNHQKAAI